MRYRLLVFFFAVAGLGLENIVIRDLVRTPEDEQNILASAFALLLLSGVSIYVLCLIIIWAFDFGDPQTSNLIRIYGLILFLRPLDVAAMVMSAKLQTRYAVWVRTFMFLLFSIVKIALLLMGSTVLAFGWAFSLELICISMFIFVISFGIGNRISLRFVSFGHSRQLLWSGFPLLLSGLSMMIYWKIDQIMLGEMVGNAQVGLYSIATKISEMWYFLPSAIITSLAPAIIKSKMISDDLYASRLQGLCAFVIWLSVAVSICVSILAPFFIPALLGVEYEASTPILLVHIWASPFAFLGGISMQWYVNENMEKIYFYRTAVGAVLNIVLNLFLLPSYGGLGAAFSTILSYACVGLLLDYFNSATRHFFWIKIRAFNPLTAIPSVQKAFATS